MDEPLVISQCSFAWNGWQFIDHLTRASATHRQYEAMFQIRNTEQPALARGCASVGYACLSGSQNSGKFFGSILRQVEASVA